jgi:hypothetical protein
VPLPVQPMPAHCDHFGIEPPPPPVLGAVVVGLAVVVGDPPPPPTAVVVGLEGGLPGPSAVGRAGSPSLSACYSSSF